MPELSNLLRQRMRLREAPRATRETLDCGKANGGGTSPVAADAIHPDADILTAYAERLLVAHERDQVLRHLGICGQCREIVLLALPEAEAAAKASAAVPVARGWRAFFTPRLGLAGSAVAAALIVGLIVESPWKSSRTAQQAVRAPNSAPSNSEASKQIPAAPAPNLAGSIPSLTPNAPLMDSGELKATGSRKEAKAASRPRVNLAATIASATPAQGPPEIYDLRTTASNVMSGPPASIEGVVAGQRRDYLNAAMFAGASTSDGSGSGSGSSNGSGVAKKELPVAPAPRAASPWKSIPYTQIPDFSQLSSVPGADRRTFVPSRPPARSLVGVLISPAQKFLRQPPLSARMLGFNNTMGGNGQLNPTKDKSQSVEVMAAAPLVGAEADLAASQAFTDHARGKALASNDAEYGVSSSAWRVAGGRLLKKGEAGSWIDAYPGESIEFSTFVVHGVNVWAGGHGAALIHSNDGGTTWERITLRSAASGTIVKIEAQGLNVQVLSSSGQSWTSVDGGKTWARED